MSRVFRVTLCLLTLACLAWPHWAAAAPPKIAASSGHALAVRADGTMVGWGQNGFGQLGLGVSGAPQTVPQAIPLSGVTDLAAGNAHSLAVIAGGVRVWGSNAGGQLGSAAIGSLLFPTTMDNVSDVVGVAAGEVHSLALRTDGTVLFWGTNISGGTNAPGVVAGLNNVLAVAAGTYHSLALRGDGTVAAWGSNGFGQLGDGSTTNRPAPVSVAGLSGAVAIAAGGNASLALKSDGTVWLWGNGQATAAAVPGLAGIAAIATSGTHHLALKSDGTVMAWGSNSSGQLGDGTAADRGVPQAVTGLTGIAAIAAGEGRSLAMRTDGTVVEWGGEDAAGIRLTAAPIPGVADVAGIVATSNHLLARKTDQSVLGFGANSTGQLGNGTQLAAGAFQPVSGLGAVSRVTTALRHSMAVLPDGSVMAWGQFFGQVCRGFNNEFQLSPAQVPALANVASIASGNGHTLVLHADGSVSACGSNGSGQLGVPGGDAGNPISISALSGVSAVAVAVGAAHSLALLATGTVRAWGENGNGQLGIGTEDNATTPTTVPGLTGVIAIAALDNFSVAIKGDGSVWAWGNNSNGQLGDGTTSRRTSPVQVSGLTGAQAVALSSEHVLALKSDGTVMAWGQNGVGQLGDGTTLERLSPVTVAGLTGASGLAAGSGISYALLADGTLRGWGLYSYCLFGCVKRNVPGAGGSGLLNLLTDQTSPAPVISRNGDEGVVPGSVVSFAVAFTEPVSGVDLADFALVTTDVVGAALISVTGSGSSYVVTLNVGTGSGDVRLRLLDNDSIQDAAGNVLGGTGAGNGQVTSFDMFIVGVVQQVITITPIADPLLTQGSVNISVTGGASGNGITYNATTPATCAVTSAANGMLVTLLAAGVCTVTADQTGNGSYLPANQETYSFNIIQGYTLTVLVPNFGNGTVSSLPAGINCTEATSPCTLGLPAGTSITLTATPGALSDFTSWSGACSGNATCTLVMNTAQTVTARFDAAPTATLSVSTAGNAVVESPFIPSGINCSITTLDDCNAAYRLGVAAALVAIPVGQTTFTGWSGDCNGNGPCNLLLTANRAVSANFQSGAGPTYAMTVITTGNGAGTVSSLPAGISCGLADICQASYPAGTMVTLSAVAEAGSTFTGWSSGGGAASCTGTGSCSVTLSAASRITATFTHAGTAQSISFPPPANRTFDAANPFFAATLSATSGLPVSLNSMSPAVCAASGNLVTANATGTCFLRAVQPGNATFAAALPQVRGFVINPAAQTITFPAIADFDWNGGSATLNATSSSGLPITYRLDSGPCVITGTVVTSSAPGGCEISALQAGNGNYLQALFVSRVITVTGALTVPGAPLIGLATPTAGGASIAFSAPVNTGGTALTGYTATCNPGATVASAMASPIVVTGLANGVVHSCSVTASNSVGTGPSSASVSVTPLSAPDAPLIGSATSQDGGALVSFSAPVSDGGSPIVGYAVTCNPGNINASGSTAPIAVTGLTNGTAYSCVVRAINVVGTSTASASASVTPQPPMALLSAVSRKSHGAAGSQAIDIDIGQPVNGVVTVEPRGSAAGPELVLTFNQPVFSAGGVSVRDAGDVLIGPVDALVAGNTVVVSMGAVAGHQRVKVVLNAVTGANGSINSQVSLGFLVGDVNNSRAVTAADIAAIKANIGQPVNSVTRARMDLNADGLVTQQDVTAARARAGRALP